MIDVLLWPEGFEWFAEHEAKTRSRAAELKETKVILNLHRSTLCSRELMQDRGSRREHRRSGLYRAGTRLMARGERYRMLVGSGPEPYKLCEGEGAA